MNTPTPRPDPQHVTQLLAAVEEGKGGASDELLVAVYDELRSLARARMRNEPAGLTLQPTALVHEAYLRLLGSGASEPQQWDHRGHFFAAAAIAMRRILVERARRYQMPKHGGGRERVELADSAAESGAAAVDLVALDQALTQLSERDPRMTEIVNLRYFAGLDVKETAAALDLSERTVKREWAVARAWLYKALGGEVS